LLSVEPFRRITIRGLLNEGDFDLEFTNAGADGGVYMGRGSDMDPLRVVYGLNGSGKTSALTIIRSLLVGDIPTLLSIPFRSVEIERWEPWGPNPDRFEPVPGGIEGMMLFSQDCEDGTFEQSYNYLKFVSKEFGIEGWYKAHISSENKKKIEDFLSKNRIMREEVERMSEPGAFEFPMCDAHSHILRIERRREEGGRDVFAAEYKQNRCPYVTSSRDGWGQQLPELLEMLGIDHRTITTLEGEEILASGELVVEPVLSEWNDFFDYLFEKEVIDTKTYHGSPFDFLGMLEPSQISEMNETGILDLMEIWKVWRAFNGDRRHWREDASISWFDKECMETHGETLGIDWSQFTSVEKRIVALIGPNEKVNSKEFVSSEVSRLQGLLQGIREEEDLLYGLNSEEEMQSNLEKYLNGEMEKDDGERFERSLVIAPFIAENLHKGAESSLSHLITLPAVVDRLGVPESHPRRSPSGRLRQLISSASHRQLLKNAYYPFFEDYNSNFLINKSMKISDNLAVIVVTDSGSVIPYSKLSHGELRLMYMLGTISDNPKSGVRWPTVLIDEPEVGLHIDWQRKLVSSIKGFYDIDDRKPVEMAMVLKARHPVKVVIATHSPEIVASSPEDAVSIEPLSDELR
jgi:hypothetical protein